MNVYKIVLHIHRLRCMAWIALTNKMADTRVSSRQLAYAYQKFVTEISQKVRHLVQYIICVTSDKSDDECMTLTAKMAAAQTQ